MKLNKAALLLAIVLFSTTMLTGYSYEVYDGLGSVYYESELNIGPGASYSEIVAKNDAAGGIEHVYMVEADPMNSMLLPFVFSGEITGKYTLSSMAGWIKKEGYNVVAAINGDLYDTASGTPKGPVIHNGILMTGGYAPEYSVAFSKNGAAFLSYSGINYTMKYKKYVYTDRTVSTVDGNGNPVIDASGNAQTEIVTDSEIVDTSVTIDYFNVPHGGANGLHLFNRHYGGTTKTSGTCVEVLLTVPNTAVANLKVGETITATVTAVNTATKSSAIGEDQLVLSTKAGSASYSELWNMVPGSTVEITVSAAEGGLLNQATESIGVYNVLARDGAVITSDKTINPRTCIGIKSNGKVILYIVDGRQGSHSKGMNAVDIAKYLIDQGCVSVVNMDGGGSTTMLARSKPGINDEAVLVNSVSDGSQRSITNGLFLVYSTTTDMTPANLCIYPSYTLMMPGASQQLSSYAVNSAYEKTSMPGEVTYSVSGNNGSVSSSGLFTAGKTLGETEITGTSGSISGSTKVKIVDDFTFAPSVSVLYLDQGATQDINIINPQYGYMDVVIADSLFTWACDPQIGMIDQNGVFTASKDAKGKTGNITVSLNSQTITIPVTVGKETDFTDISDHWARAFIIALTNEGIITGITPTTFEPDSSLTRAQFLVLLSKLDSAADITGAGASNFSDVSPDEWFYRYVNWGVANNIVSGTGDGAFKPNDKVTREQMCVMLNNFATAIGIEFAAAEVNLAFSDNHLISDWALSSIKRIVSEGIMSGKPNNVFDPIGTATRAEAARIVYAVKDFFE